MTAAMLLIQRLLPRSSQEHLEPRQIVDEGLEHVADSSELSDTQRRRLSLVAHFSYGAMSGAVYPAFEKAYPGPGRGPLYGMLLFAASYAGWLPALDILPPPTRRPRGRNALLAISHLVWGATLQYCCEAGNKWSSNERTAPQQSALDRAAVHARRVRQFSERDGSAAQ